MAQANYKFKMGSATCELITGAAVANSETEITHTLGVAPDMVIITPQKSATVYESAAATSSEVKLTGSAADSTSNLLLIVDTAKIKTA